MAQGRGGDRLASQRGGDLSGNDQSTCSCVTLLINTRRGQGGLGGERWARGRWGRALSSYSAPCHLLLAPPLLPLPPYPTVSPPCLRHAFSLLFARGFLLFGMPLYAPGWWCNCHVLALFVIHDLSSPHSLCTFPLSLPFFSFTRHSLCSFPLVLSLFLFPVFSPAYHLHHLYAKAYK